MEKGKKRGVSSIPGASKMYRSRIKETMKQNQGSHIADLHNNGRRGLHQTIAQCHAAYTQAIQRELLSHPSSAVQEAAAHLRHSGGVAFALSNPLSDDSEPPPPRESLPPAPPPPRTAPAPVLANLTSSTEPGRSAQPPPTAAARRPVSRPYAPYACPFEEEEKVGRRVRVEVEGKSAQELLAESERLLLMGIGGPPVRRRGRQCPRPKLIAGELGDMKSIKNLPRNVPGKANAPVTLPGIGGS
eukprot:Hpha_TRINITY_DN16740_c2_g3::TRINITY_DN16740_c2_g3_i1::g.79894::m.79894